MGNEPEHRAGGTPAALRSAPWLRRHRGPYATLFRSLVFPANAGTQGPSSSGRQPKGHRATAASVAQRVLFFKRAQAPCQQKTYCAEVRSVATAPPRLLGPRFRGGNEWGMNPSTVPAERPLR